MLDDEGAVSLSDECIKRLEELFDVVEVETRGGLIKDEQRVFTVIAFNKERSQLDAVRFTNDVLPEPDTPCYLFRRSGERNVSPFL